MSTRIGFDNYKDTKRKKSMALRYRKAISKDVNYDWILYDLQDIWEECDDVRYFFEGDSGEALIDAMDGDIEQANEFRMMFSVLSSDCEAMMSDLQYEYVPDCFDVFFVAMDAEPLLGWDNVENDYFGILQGSEATWAVTEGRKKLERLTKAEIIDVAQVCFSVFKSYIGIKDRYDSLKAAMDILKDQNGGYLEMVREIEKTYDAAEKDSDGFTYQQCDSVAKLDRLINSMPQIAWLE